MIPRTLGGPLTALAEKVPVVAVTGPRQSGKTTLCQASFPDHPYVSLEPLDTREFAVQDPRGFLSSYPEGAVLDEVQRAPALFSYLQELVDQDPAPGRFILTGSQHFGLTEAITQSLAGRIGQLHLLPLSLDEVRRFPSYPVDLWESLFIGGFPRIYDRGLEPAQWLGDYVATYVQRDVRQVLNVTDLDAFTTFLRLAATRTGQELNLAGLGADAGVTHNTARAWISVLEASFIVFRTPGWHRNLRKRAIKTAKLHFVDSGLACWLLGIRDRDQLRLHPLRGAIFESWVASEILKARLHNSKPADLFHLRQDRGSEVDLIVEAGDVVRAVEVKSGATIASDFLTHLVAFGQATREQHPHLRTELRLVHGGAQKGRRDDVELIPWEDVQAFDW
jgi:uncharacterized protein